MMKKRARTEMVREVCVETGLILNSIRRLWYPRFLGPSKIVFQKGTVSSELKRQVRLDVLRTEEVDKDELHRYIVRIFEACPFLSYYQGFHDICRVLRPLLPDSDDAARVALIFFRDHMQVSMKTTMYDMELIPLVLLKIDPELSMHLERIPHSSFLFCLSWVLTWFSHDVDDKAAARIFDFLLVHPPYAIFFMCAVFIHFHRKPLLSMQEYASIHAHLSSAIQKTPIDPIIRATAKWLRHFPLSKISFEFGPYSMCATKGDVDYEFLMAKQEDWVQERRNAHKVDYLVPSLILVASTILWVILQYGLE